MVSWDFWTRKKKSQYFLSFKWWYHTIGIIPNGLDRTLNQCLHLKSTDLKISAISIFNSIFFEDPKKRYPFNWCSAFTLDGYLLDFFYLVLKKRGLFLKIVSFLWLEPKKRIKNFESILKSSSHTKHQFSSINFHSFNTLTFLVATIGFNLKSKLEKEFFPIFEVLMHFNKIF